MDWRFNVFARWNTTEINGNGRFCRFIIHTLYKYRYMLDSDDKSSSNNDAKSFLVKVLNLDSK